MGSRRSNGRNNHGRRRLAASALAAFCAGVAAMVTAVLLVSPGVGSTTSLRDNPPLGAPSMRGTPPPTIPNLAAPTREQLLAQEERAKKGLRPPQAIVPSRVASFEATSTGAASAVAGGANTLVLYDTTGPWGWLGELYAMYGANLVSHFGSWTAKPVASYAPGELANYTALLYLGSTYDEPLPEAFLDDAYTTTKPVIWAYHNIWQMTARQPGFQAKYGWNWWQYDTGPIASVVYKGRTLTRYAANAGGIMTYSPLDTTRVTTVGEAVRSDGSRFPWAVRSGNLTYVGEMPFAYTSESDRFMVFADLLFDALAPQTPERHRALVRIEDISPTSDPGELRAIADYLARVRVPFGFGVSPLFRDPNGVLGGPTSLRLRDAPAVVDAIRYMQSKGGTLIEHGYTHQYNNVANPYNAVSGDDTEFYRVTENPDHTINFVGPVPEDTSIAWGAGRIADAHAEFVASGLVAPTIFEFPHYTASSNAYQAAAALFPARWERSLYFSGTLTGPVDHSRYIGQMFPYDVRDVYGDIVLPENLGNYEPEAFFIYPPRPVAQILADAERNLVIRDGFASFYFHPFLKLGALRQLVEGIKRRGYTFVEPASLLG
jgi:uncharacterized protein YdaL